MVSTDQMVFIKAWSSFLLISGHRMQQHAENNPHDPIHINHKEESVPSRRSCGRQHPSFLVEEGGLSRKVKPKTSHYQWSEVWTFTRLVTRSRSRCQFGPHYIFSSWRWKPFFPIHSSNVPLIVQTAAKLWQYGTSKLSVFAILSFQESA